MILSSTTRQRLAMAILSLILMFFIGEPINQALVVLGFYAFMLAGKLGGEW